MDIFVIIARLFLPLFILRFPLFGGILALFLDGIDWPISTYRHTLVYENYQMIDKILDLYYLSLEAITVLSWKDVFAKKIALFSYWVRYCGVLLFSFSQLRFILFLFPNIFELFFLFFTANKCATRKEFLPRSLLYLFVVCLLIPKLFQEYLIHVALVPIWQFTYFHFSTFQFRYDNIYGQLIFVLFFLFFAKKFGSLTPIVKTPK